MEGKYVGDLQQVVTLSPSAQLIVVQDSLTQRSTVGELLLLLTDPEVTSTAGIPTVVTEATVTTIVQSELVAYDTRINANAVAIGTNASDITALGSRVQTVETSSTNWNTAFSWGNHVAVGYEKKANKGSADGYCALDVSSLVPMINLPLLDQDKIPLLDLGKIPVLTADKLPTITQAMLPTITRDILPAITNADLPLLDSSKIPDIFPLRSEVDWHQVDKTSITDFDPLKEYRVMYLDDITSKTLVSYPYKVQNTRMFFNEYYMNSDSKVSFKDETTADLSNFSVIEIHSRSIGVVA